jgi:replicative DNA helicase
MTPLHALEQLEAWRQARAATRTTGFAELDDVTGGFEPGQVWIVVGTPGQGRSTVAVQWASLLAGVHGLDTQLVSKRDPVRKVAARLVASAAKVPELHLWHDRMSSQDQGRIGHAKRTLGAMPLLIVDPSGISIADTDLDEVARPEALVVDDAELAGGLFPSRVADLAASWILIVLTLPRDLVLSDDGVDPAWSRVADVIIDVDRPELRDRASLRPGEADFHLLRNRWGPMRSLGVVYQGHYARFIDGTPTRNR